MNVGYVLLIIAGLILLGIITWFLHQFVSWWFALFMDCIILAVVGILNLDN